MWRDLVRLVTSWWRVDRIRASPKEGALLRLSPPCLVRAGGMLLELCERSVGEDADGPFVAYASADGACLLVRPLGTAGRVRLRLGNRPLDEHEVELIG